jgi:hypothetical protein
VLYTENRYAAAYWNDAISYGGQTVALAALYAAHLSHGYPFTGALALYVLAATSALAALVGIWQLRHSLLPAIDWRDLSENWHFGKWLLGGELLGWSSSLHMQVWWAALLLGTWASADLRAAQILFGPTRVIAFFLGTILPIRFARTLHIALGRATTRGESHDVHAAGDRLFQGRKPPHPRENVLRLMRNALHAIRFVFAWIDEPQIAQAEIFHAAHDMRDVDQILRFVENDGDHRSHAIRPAPRSQTAQDSVDRPAATPTRRRHSRRAVRCGACDREAFH